MDFIDREIARQRTAQAVDAELQEDLASEAEKREFQVPPGLTNIQICLLDALDAGGVLQLCECIVEIVQDNMASEADEAEFREHSGRAGLDQQLTQDEYTPEDSDSIADIPSSPAEADGLQTDDLIEDRVPDSQPPFADGPSPHY